MKKKLSYGEIQAEWEIQKAKVDRLISGRHRSNLRGQDSS